jgi:beta-glucosidase/6-phospho-beta-glucosidase/beta-galactosidase
MKGFPWYFTDMLSSDDEFELLEKMGVNVVRLGYMWTGAMPSENYFNKTVRS